LLPTVKKILCIKKEGGETCSILPPSAFRRPTVRRHIDPARITIIKAGDFQKAAAK
jgi:hypothetical protein